MRIDPEAQVVAIVTRTEVKFMEVVKSDKRGKLTLWDGTEWNSRTGRRWGDSNKFRMFPTTLTTKEQGERTVAYRAAQAADNKRMEQYKESVSKITQALNVYYANDLSTVKEKIAAARAELEKLEAAFA